MSKYLKSFYVKDYIYILIGLSLYAVGLVGFIKPGEIVTGALAGICLLIEYSTGIKLQYSYFTINAVLLLLSFKLLGGDFLKRTIFGVISLTLLLSLFEFLITKPLLQGEPILSGVIGGMMCGAGIGLVFSSNGSTGGTDIIVAAINKFKNLSFGRGMLLCDFLIISSSYLVFQDFNKIVTGLIVMGVMTYTIDMVINGFRQSVQFLIFSTKHEEIAKVIMSETHRGCTYLDGTGAYTNNPIKVVVLLAKRSESVQIFRLIKSIDENAFISQSTVRGVYGQGFDQIKA